jgi:HEAT repeat protein
LEAPSSDRAAAEALVSPEPALQAAGVAAALVLATREHRASRRAFEPPDGRVDLRQLLERLLPTNYTPDEHARALERLAPALARACVAAAQSSPESARTVAEALLARDGKPAFGPLTRDIERLSPALKKKAEQSAELVASAVVGPFVALSSHPSAEIRQLSVRFLGTRPEASARKHVIIALEDRDEHVQRTALTGLAALGGGHRADAIEAIVALLAGRSDWPVRVRAAEALGELAKGSRNPRAVTALGQASQKDSYALVREASLRALFAVDEAAARPIMKQVADKDSEPRVRELARELSKRR